MIIFNFNIKEGSRYQLDDNIFAAVVIIKLRDEDICDSLSCS